MPLTGFNDLAKIMASRFNQIKLQTSEQQMFNTAQTKSNLFHITPI